MEKEQPEPWFFGFEEYKKIGEPNKREKTFAWMTAIGLQAVDGLSPSKYLLETAKRHIEGEITIEEAKQLIDNYYESEEGRVEEKENRTEEADKVSTRIAQILNDGTFSFRPVTLENIHEHLFKGIYKFAGKIRTYNISKKEWVLNGDSVYYTDFHEIRAALKYDFDEESNFSYENIPTDDFIKHFSRFISNIWQVHAFGEGNTRTTAVFTIKYLRTLGYEVNNDPFIEHSWYFRNALVRASYSSRTINYDTSYLELFFRNLLLGEENELRNRYTHIFWKKGFKISDFEKMRDEILNGKNDPVNPEIDPLNPENNPVNDENDLVNNETDPLNPETDPLNVENDLVNCETDPLNAETDPVNDKNDLVNVENAPLNQENDPVNDENDPVNPEIDLVNLLLKTIKNNPAFTYAEYAKILKKSAATVKRRIQKLKAEGKIERVGADKNGFWKVLDTENDNAK